MPAAPGRWRRAGEWPRANPHALLALLVAALVPSCASVSKETIQRLKSEDQGVGTVETLGCFHYGYKYHPEMKIPGHTQPFHMRSATHCQAWCRATEGCRYFAYWVGKRECWLGGANARLMQAKSFGAVAGPANCPKQPVAMCNDEIPDYLFPAPDYNVSLAAWPSGYQPTNLQCWPRKASGFPQNCSGQEVQILEDTDDGWSGRCDGLRAMDLEIEKCQLRCFLNPICAVWQIKGSPMQCFHGMFGVDCYKISGERPVRAQMLLHGDFRVLMNTARIQIMGLAKAFDVSEFDRVEDAEKACRKACISYLLCQHWQFSNVYGCWVEDPRVSRVAYPLVNDGVGLKASSEGARTVTGGEFIQHLCKRGPAVPLPTEDPSSWPTDTSTTTSPLISTTHGLNVLPEILGGAPIEDLPPPASTTAIVVKDVDAPPSILGDPVPPGPAPPSPDPDGCDGEDAEVCLGGGALGSTASQGALGSAAPQGALGSAAPQGGAAGQKSAAENIITWALLALAALLCLLCILAAWGLALKARRKKHKKRAVGAFADGDSDTDAGGWNTEYEERDMTPPPGPGTQQQYPQHLGPGTQQQYPQHLATPPPPGSTTQAVPLQPGMPPPPGPGMQPTDSYSVVAQILEAERVGRWQAVETAVLWTQQQTGCGAPPSGPEGPCGGLYEPTPTQRLY